MGKILLTGASGFIAAHCLNSCLRRGWKVRFTVRSEEKAQNILATNIQWKHLLDYVVVPDISSPDAYKDVFQDAEDITAVVHTASPFYLTFEKPEELLLPAINGTRNLLHAIKEAAPQVKRVVITSSFASIIDPSKGMRPGHVYSENDWNPITSQEAMDPATAKIDVYRASKKLAEKVVEEFVQEFDPPFSVVTLCPPMVFGPIINDQTLESLNSSNVGIWDFLSGKVETITPNRTHLWVDVRDLGEVHAKAVEVDIGTSKYERYFVVADEAYSNQDTADILRKYYPDKKATIPEGKPGTGIGLEPGEYYAADNSKSKKAFNITYRGYERTVIDTAQTLLRLQQDVKI